MEAKKLLVNEQFNLKKLIKSIIKVALPISLQGVLLSMVQLVDNLFLGQLPLATDVAAGVNAVNNLTFIMNSIVVGFMSGIGVYFAQAAGKKNYRQQKQLFMAKIFWTLFLTAILMLIILPLLPILIKIWLPTNQDISYASKAALNYGYIIIPGLLMSFIILIFTSSFNEQKKTWVSMSVAISGIVINSALNYPLMYIANLGIQGSAIATLVAWTMQLIIWLFYIFLKRPLFIFGAKEKIKLTWKSMFHIFPKSFWWMINGLIINFGFTLQIMLMSRISIDAGGALNLAGVVAQILYAFTNAYTLALSIIMMHHLAQVKEINFQKYLYKWHILSICFGLIIGLIFASFSWTVFYLYPNYNQNTKIQAVIMLLAISSTIWLNLWVGTYLSLFKGVGLTKIILLFDGLYTWFITLPTTFFLVTFAVDDLPFGYIYWIVTATVIGKPFFLKIYFQKNHHKFKILQIHKKQQKILDH